MHDIVLKLFKEGKPFDEISSSVKLPLYTVTRMIGMMRASLGVEEVPYRRTPRFFGNRYLRQVDAVPIDLKKLFQSGLDNSEIAQRTGLTLRQVVYQRCRMRKMFGEEAFPRLIKKPVDSPYYEKYPILDAYILERKSTEEIIRSLSIDGKTIAKRRTFLRVVYGVEVVPPVAVRYRGKKCEPLQLSLPLDETTSRAPINSVSNATI